MGGITPARDVTAMGKMYGLKTAWHGPGDTSRLDMPQISTLIYGRQTSGSKNGVDSMSCVMKFFLVCRRLKKVICTQMIALVSA